MDSGLGAAAENSATTRYVDLPKAPVCLAHPVEEERDPLTILMMMIGVVVYSLLEARKLRHEKLRTLSHALHKVQQDLNYQAISLSVKSILAQCGITQNWSTHISHFTALITASHQRGEGLALALRTLQANLQANIRLQERSHEQLVVLVGRLIASGVCASLTIDVLNLFNLIELDRVSSLFMGLIFWAYGLVACHYVVFFPDAALAEYTYLQRDILMRWKRLMSRNVTQSLTWVEAWLQLLLMESHPEGRKWFWEWYQLKQDSLRLGVCNVKTRHQRLTDAMRTQLQVAKKRQRLLTQLFPVWQLLLFSLVMLAILSVSHQI